jgi:hypothetical protein
MAMETIFSTGSSVALLGWLLLVFVPYWRGIAQFVAAVAIPVVLSLAYTALIGVWWSRAEGGFSSIEDVETLFQSRPMLVAGWLHYLAFDLWFGAWISREARKEGIPHLLVVPLLPLTLMFGPIGFLAFTLMRAAWRGGRGEFVLPFLTKAATLWRGFAAREPALVKTGLVLALAMIPTALCYALDDRTLNGVSIWLKPLKFQASLALFAFTLAFFMPMASTAFRRSWAGLFVVWGFIIPTFYEILYIAWRASMGEASHFNVETPAAAMLYRLMGIGAVTLTFTAPVLAWGILRRDAPPAVPVYRLAVVLGLVLTFVLGTSTGMMMGGRLTHAVGLPLPGDTGWPVLGWLYTAGDLRVAHFFGIHAQQVIPIAGALLVAFVPAMARTGLVAFTALYTLFTLAVLAQALAGMPLIPA